ncbi:HAD family hydrolase [Thermococcus celer]|uniref:2-haloalkanoic acid dehalogenase n=1 Tax=Thermococcus celer Vu 13 = JCM 8558 TaxID=1293037 RepID=A0A218P027_THECE|nr:HAD family hydrolase [Thermococcus celer]ASI98281.1 2-haloalkanoic acid dehalogenase [Thermococcus celer Vu 13 = JCM 8558]
MRLVSFDVWNTLLDINAMLDAMAVELSKLMGACIVDVVEGMLLTRERIKRMRARTQGDPERVLEESQGMLAELLGIDVELVRRAAARAVLGVDEEMVLPGAREALEGVRKKGMKVTVTGNVMFWPGSYTRLLLERLGLMDYIDRTFFADEVGAFKPMPEMFGKPMETFRVEPDEAIHIGDTYAEDFEGALKAGMWAVWINPGAEKVRRIHERGFEVPSVEGILEVLERVEGSI